MNSLIEREDALEMNNFSARAQYIKLNHIDFLWLVMSRLFPSFGQLITLRFTTKHSPHEIKKAVRSLLSAYPRMRSLLENKITGLRLKVLADNDPLLERLFDESFFVKHDMIYDDRDYSEYRKKLFNEPFDLEHGLAFKIHYLPDGNTPVLFLSIHHVLTDARGWLHMLNTFMSFLNGAPVKPLPADNPSLVPSALLKPWYAMPGRLLVSFKTYKKNMNVKRNDIPIIHARRADFCTFGDADLFQSEISHPFSAIHAKSHELGCSIFAFTELCIAAISMAIRKTAHSLDGNVIQIYFIIDMRPLFHQAKPIFGNYLLLGMIRIPGEAPENPHNLITIVRSELMENLRQVKKRETMFPMMLNKLSTFMGLRNYTKAARYAKGSGKVPLTYIFSNIGHADRLNSHGTKAQICEVIGTVPQNGIFISSSILGDRINTGISYPVDIFTRDEIKNFFHAFDSALEDLLKV